MSPHDLDLALLAELREDLQRLRQDVNRLDDIASGQAPAVLELLRQMSDMRQDHVKAVGELFDIANKLHRQLAAMEKRIANLDHGGDLELIRP